MNPRNIAAALAVVAIAAVGCSSSTVSDVVSSGPSLPSAENTPGGALDREQMVLPGTDSETSATSDTMSDTLSGTAAEPPALPALPTAEIVLGQVDGGFAESQGLTGGLGHPVVMVTSSSDSGPGTYREAISTGDRIVRFDPSLDGTTIALDHYVETAASNLTIDGSGMTVTISGRATRFSGTNIVIAGLTFSGNDATDEEDAITFRDAEAVQVFGLFGNTFESAADGLVDVIWNGGNDVYGTICGNVFRHHDKAVLFDSGEDDREGGHYFVTLCDNYWFDVYQRMPLSRWASVHQYNSVFESYGKPDGTGGGSKSGGDGSGVSQHLLEGNIAIPRAVGEVTFDGQTVTAPRAEWAASQLDTDGGVKVVGNLLGTTGDVTATEFEHDVDEVFTPPYEYDLHPATLELADVIRASAGVCVSSGRVGAVNPCAPLLLTADGTLIIEIAPSAETEIAAVSAVQLVVGEQRLPARQLDQARWEIDISAIGQGPTAVWAEVTTSDGRVAATDVVLAAPLP
ncbi:MAG TPA: hypothetical protein VMM60_12485 [Ilumatobacter sp.]|nr:hypothetical protein [Ilumatobacter sp.]